MELNRSNAMTMPRRYWFASTLALGLVARLAVVGAPHAEQPPAPEWKLVWSDEFDGKDIDRAKWDFDQGNGFYNYDANTWIAGWGNGELQYYTGAPKNAFVKDGMLHLRVL